MIIDAATLYKFKKKIVKVVFETRIRGMNFNELVSFIKNHVIVVLIEVKESK